jgi:hypothetical protein
LRSTATRINRTQSSDRAACDSVNLLVAPLLFGGGQLQHRRFANGIKINLRDPLHRRLLPLRFLHDRPDCCRLERKLHGGTTDLPLGNRAFPRRTTKTGTLESSSKTAV